MLQNAGILGADAIIFDLEDAVAPREKDAARLLVCQALKTVDYGACEKIVRINPIDASAQEDIAAVVPYRPDAILLPKANKAEDVWQVVEWIKAAEAQDQPPISIIALLETPLGIVNSFAVASAHPRIVAIALGAED